MSRQQFWIDVGGTFTDCLVCETDGSIRALKVLSSGVVKGQIEDVQDEGWVQVSGLKGFGDKFFEGYRVRTLAPSGEILWTGRVLASVSGGRLRLGRDGDSSLGFEVGTNVELDAGEPAPLLAIRQARKSQRRWMAKFGVILWGLTSLLFIFSSFQSGDIPWQARVLFGAFVVMSLCKCFVSLEVAAMRISRHLTESGTAETEPPRPVSY